MGTRGPDLSNGYNDDVRRLLIEKLLSDSVEGSPSPSSIYVEDLGYSLAPDGSPYVEASSGGGTRTLSEIGGEEDDFDGAADSKRTFTFVATEEEDEEAGLDVLSTETAIRAEDPDRSEWAATTTFTKIENEAEDRE